MNLNVDVTYTGPEALDPDAVRGEVERQYRRYGVKARVHSVEYRGKQEKKRERRLVREAKYWTAAD